NTRRPNSLTWRRCPWLMRWLPRWRCARGKGRNRRQRLPKRYSRKPVRFGLLRSVFAVGVCSLSALREVRHAGRRVSPVIPLRLVCTMIRGGATVRLRILLTVALVVVLVAVGSVSALAQKKVLRYGMAQADIGGMDPHNAPGTNDKTVIDPMFNGLV